MTKYTQFMLSYTWPGGTARAAAGTTMRTKVSSTTPERAARQLGQRLDKWCAKHGRTRPANGWDIQLVETL